MDLTTGVPTLAVDACPARPSLFLYRLFRNVLPQARRALSHWTSLAMQIPDPGLREQALASLRDKRFHADGGCVFAAAVTADASEPLVQVIVALQTISDYLDNLCDRTEATDERDFFQLHHAMRDAVHPARGHQPYYLHRDGDDGGYLNALVSVCQARLAAVPHYDDIEHDVTWLVERYCELQQIKHTYPIANRSRRLQAFAAPYLKQFPELQWWEFAAATGSTLAVFALITSALTAAAPTVQASKSVARAYFPWICGLHILLDYLIDVDEDQRGGDFNFVLCYDRKPQAIARLHLFGRRSLAAADTLAAHSAIHRHVVLGLLGMYLSDKKALRQPLARSAKRLVWAFGPTACLYYGACVLYRTVR